MKESYGEGLATHTGSESCGATREGDLEALNGGTRAPGIQPRKNLPPGRRCRKEKRKAASGPPIWRRAPESRAKAPFEYSEKSVCSKGD